MNPWRPDPNPIQARRVGKTMEELAECMKILARISIQGLDELDPATGTVNRSALMCEIADVRAQFDCLEEALGLLRLRERERTKRIQMREWEEVLRNEMP